jgi:DNA-binding CsgD family transcriptional regulator
VAGSVAFVGRDRELSRLQAALGGDARLLLVMGDAGVGKTRLVAEGLRRATADGLIMAAGGCLPLAEKLPLLPVADALTELGRLEQGRTLEAALGTTPPYVRIEVARLLPQLGSAGKEPPVSDGGGRAEEWRQERLFTAIAELLEAAAARTGLCLVVEDVHWADTATLDFLTFLVRAGHGSAVTVVVTCRSDEAPLEPRVSGWLGYARANAAVEEIRLGPLSAAETAEQVAGLVGGLPPTHLASDVFARGEGNPFFTEQLVAATLAEHPADVPDRARGLPARLGELLAARTAGCAAQAQAVLAALAVAGRPLTEDVLVVMTGLAPEAARQGLRELAAARLLGEARADGTYRARHALLAEAVAGGLLPGELKVLHERCAEALQAAWDETLAAEVAGHWAAAGHPERELEARVAAASVAERVFGYAEAAVHWQRAIGLCERMPRDAETAGLSLPRLYVRAIDALEMSGEVQQARTFAEDAYRRFADDADRATTAVILLRAGHFRGLQTRFFGDRDVPNTGLPLIEEALRLFETGPPCAEQAQAWLDYGRFQPTTQEGGKARDRAMAKALEVAEAVGATALVAQLLSFQAYQAFTDGKIAEGFALIDRGLDLAEAAGDAEASLWVAVEKVYALASTGQNAAAVDVALSALATARDTGRQSGLHAAMLVANATSALLATGRTADAAALVDPLTGGAPDRDHWIMHLSRGEIDMVRGDIAAAADRRMRLSEVTGELGSGDWGRSAALWTAELALWDGRPADALEEIRHVLLPIDTHERAIVCAPLLTVGIRACADLAELARARRDEDAAGAAQASAAELASWVDRMSGAPFRDHAFVADVPAQRATWHAERTRLDGAGDPGAWEAAARAWEELGNPQRAGYAWWRRAEVLLAAGRSAASAAALQNAAAGAQAHAPLLAQVRKLAERAHIPIQAPPAPSPAVAPSAAPRRYGLTSREAAVLRLLVAGRTNAQIGAELYMSPKTASVHVTSIMRKLGVTSRVQAAAVAERAGLLHDELT